MGFQIPPNIFWHEELIIIITIMVKLPEYHHHHRHHHDKAPSSPLRKTQDGPFLPALGFWCLQGSRTLPLWRWRTQNCGAGFVWFSSVLFSWPGLAWLLYPMLLTHSKGNSGSVNIYFHLVVTIFNAWGHLVSFTNPLAAGSEARNMSTSLQIVIWQYCLKGNPVTRV